MYRNLDYTRGRVGRKLVLVIIMFSFCTTLLIVNVQCASWESVACPTTADLNSVFMVDSSEGWAVGYDGTILRLTDWNASAQPTPTEPEPTTPVPTEPEPTTPEPATPEPTEPTTTEPISGITLSSEWVAIILSIGGLAAGAGTWTFRTHHARKRNKILFNKLMEDIDDVYSRFRMNKLRCESELYKYKNHVLEDFKQGMIDEEKFNILDERINNYLKEIIEKNAKDRTL